jgi:uncharacterized protein YbaR (Trm112 family)
MAFELKILDIISCPRCNATAELRIDQKKTNSKYVLVYMVCSTCRLNRYSHTTTPKAVKIRGQIKRLKSKQGNRKVHDKISELERLEKAAEREF